MTSQINYVTEIYSADKLNYNLSCDKVSNYFY